MIYNCGAQVRPVEYKTDQTVVLNDIAHLSQIYHEIEIIYLKEYNKEYTGIKTMYPHQVDSKDEILMVQTADKI